MEPITEITEHAVVTADGRARPVDTIILATGFATTKFLGALDVVGRGGVHIDDAWADGPQAYLGITTTGLPEPVHAVRPEHQQRLDHLHDRVPGRLRHAAVGPHGRRGDRRRRREARGDGRVQRRAAGHPRRGGGVAGGLPRLLPRAVGAHRHAVAGVDVGVPRPHATSRPRRVRDRHRVRPPRSRTTDGVRAHHPPHRPERESRVGARLLRRSRRKRGGTRSGASTTS